MLETPIRVATEWESLACLWQELRSAHYNLEPYVLAYLMPWIRECLADFDGLSMPVDVSRIERKAIDKELHSTMSHERLERHRIPAHVQATHGYRTFG